MYSRRITPEPHPITSHPTVTSNHIAFTPRHFRASSRDSHTYTHTHTHLTCPSPNIFHQRDCKRPSLRRLEPHADTKSATIHHYHRGPSTARIHANNSRSTSPHQEDALAEPARPGEGVLGVPEPVHAPLQPPQGTLDLGQGLAARTCLRVLPLRATAAAAAACLAFAGGGGVGTCGL